MKRTILALVIPLVTVLVLPAPLHADPPEVIKAEAQRNGMGWRIDVTLAHPDSGWDHYADGWRIEDKAGNTLAYRELMHPHVEEQPFTRSLFNVMLPDGMKEIWIRAHCNTDGWSEARHALALAP
ncbi:hypothetical protein [Rhodalgimonas zhirmunskyi]|uniref:Uncharacterized protein n=1 Tax=Rhodalgimonas zhirmunskyi TaxID=2964767 RepID=A0AAJ1X5E8_9RHOB|nr:hypothetical protein [Rhodoalgimonas zhirmunskyi]MDQ2094084.1 hypothetical protein [Rhodoalgimonas zhirmunskyi]